ncbi:MAG: fibronectin type III domain-containing protein, partial [Chitinophagales bacterium]
ANTTLHDTHIAIYELPGGDCTDLTDLVELGCSEDEGVEGPNGWTSITTMTGLTPGTTYYVQVDGYGASTGTTLIEVTSPCSEPTALMVANETDNSADLSWTSNGGEAEWEVEYGLTGFTPGMGMTAIATTNPYTLTGLDEDSEYEFYVSAICGAGDTSVQSVVDTITTLYLCDDPTMLAVSNITSTSMDVSWMDNAGTGTASIEYGAPGFTPGTGTTVAATTNPATITGLTAEEDYDVYITADCGANGASAAVGPVSATTLESCPAPSGIMTSNVTASSVDVAWTENGPATAWEVEYVATGGAQGSGTVVSATSNPFTVTGLAENTSYDVYVRAICGAGDESDWFGGAGTTFMTGEACPDPSGLLASNITGNTAELSWTENGTATLWSIEYGAPGFTPGTGTTANASSNPFTLNGLAASSDYEFYLTSLCANMIISNQVGPSASFTTSSVDIVDLGNGQTVDVYSYDNTIALTFENVSIPSAQVVVYDIIGQQVANEVVETVGTQTIQLDNVTTGVYLVRLAIDKETNTIKVFLQNN